MSKGSAHWWVSHKSKIKKAKKKRELANMRLEFDKESNKTKATAAKRSVDNKIVLETAEKDCSGEGNE